MVLLGFFGNSCKNKVPGGNNFSGTLLLTHIYKGM
jgi:hypothetical protein